MEVGRILSAPIGRVKRQMNYTNVNQLKIIPQFHQPPIPNPVENPATCQEP
jgi:hypothetical protein